MEQGDILISKNQALQILCLKHHVYKASLIIDINPRKFNPVKIKQRHCRVLLLYYNNKQKHTIYVTGWQVLSRFLVPYVLFN